MLEGSCEIPEGTDRATRLLLEECARMYQSMSPSEIATFLTVDDYQYYWKKVKERTSSSYCRLHFGHYIAAADIKVLARLHAKNL